QRSFILAREACAGNAGLRAPLPHQPLRIDPMDVDKTVNEEHHRGATLYREFAGRIDSLRAQGLVDCKLKITVGSDTTPTSVVSTLNHALRLLRIGRGRPLNYGP